MVVEVLDRLDELTLPDGHLAAGCLFQTVWNVLDGQDPQHGISDYDVIYFDDAELSWDAEDVVIQRSATAFADLPIEVEVRNQARVHLWYEDHFGVPYSPLGSCADAIDRYAAQACRYGIHPDDRSWSVYAPVGYDDLFAMVVRPNPVVAPREVYQAKAARWQALWPRLRILDWSDEP
jgi:hypothetical protein